MRQKIIQFCKLLHLDSVGFVSYEQFPESLKTCLGDEITTFNVETIISIAFPYCYEPINTLKNNGFSIYTKRLDYHLVVKTYLSQIAQFIEENFDGETQIFVDSNHLPERYIALLAGIGFIGKNQMFITPKYGSYVFLGEIVTNLKINTHPSTLNHEGFFSKSLVSNRNCGNCQICINCCPGKALSVQNYNSEKCLSQLTQKKQINEEEEHKIQKSGLIFGCDYCQLCCPYNKNIELSPLELFQKLDIMEQEPEIYATMTNAFFKEYLKKSACGWRGKKVIERNAKLKVKQS